MLGVKPDVSQDDLKRAYHTQAVKWHPDKNRENLVEAEERFKKIQQVRLSLQLLYMVYLWCGLVCASLCNTRDTLHVPSTIFVGVPSPAFLGAFPHIRMRLLDVLYFSHLVDRFILPPLTVSRHGVGQSVK